MPTTQTKDLLHQLRSGTWDVANASQLEQTPWNEFVAELRALYPVMFQERLVDTKREIGLARSLQFQLAVRRLPDSLFTLPCLLPVLRRCLFANSYEETLSEITISTGIRVRPAGGSSRNVILKMGRGHKLDRTPDGWVLKPLEMRSVTLTEAFLSKRGWRFDTLRPFHS